MLARLRGMVQALRSPETPEPDAAELMPTWDASSAPGLADTLDQAPQVPEADPPEVAAADSATVELPPTEEYPAPVVAAAQQTGTTLEQQLCPYCRLPRTGEQVYCDNCGWIFATPTDQPTTSAEDLPRTRLQERYQLLAKLGERGQVVRYRGLDHATGAVEPVPVVVLQAPLPPGAQAGPAEVQAGPDRVEATEASESLTSEQSVNIESTLDAIPLESVWPSIAWERSLLEKASHSSLPRVLDQFCEADAEYLVMEQPVGQTLWDAWDDPEATAEKRFDWLKQIAGALYHLHQHGAILEGLRPDIVVVAASGEARFTDLSDLLPLPLPANPPIRATPYTAPELILASDRADARADLYSFGAMLYALHVGRELTELDFEFQGVPKPFLQRFPDVHPLFGRLVAKTFCRELGNRFPTEEAAGEDPTGFVELIRTLETCQRALDRVRFEIAAWTTTGMVRTGNEDAFALLHAVESKEENLEDSALILLADGMGGYEAGEVAATLAIQVMRQFLTQQPPFATLVGAPAVLVDDSKNQEGAPVVVTPEICKQLMARAMKEANQQVYQAARNQKGQSGMGCTAEVVYVNGRLLLVGHVGDSRTYHLQQGNLVAVTRDQTWVNRMVEIGALTLEEAEEHPRRNELQQAIGGHSEVEPALYEATLKAGDWVVVCSDGLSNHLAEESLKEVLQTSASAETAARRLVNFVNLAGATDNATVVVIRAT
jgi:protein phosphatase